jgi:hypothetical protein
VTKACAGEPSSGSSPSNSGIAVDRRRHVQRRPAAPDREPGPPQRPRHWRPISTSTRRTNPSWSRTSRMCRATNGTSSSSRWPSVRTRTAASPPRYPRPTTKAATAALTSPSRARRELLVFPTLRPEPPASTSVIAGKADQVRVNGGGTEFDSNRTLRAPRQELWYPPSNAMGRFNEATDPQVALAARAERPRVLAGLHDSTKWPGIPTS